MFLILVLLAFSGCSTATTMPIDPELASRSEPMRVRITRLLWKKRLSFGPFEAWLSSGIPWERVSGDLADLGLVRQSHRFKMTDGEARLDAECRTRRRVGWTINVLHQVPLVQARCAPWRVKSVGGCRFSRRG